MSYVMYLYYIVYNLIILRNVKVEIKKDIFWIILLLTYTICLFVCYYKKIENFDLFIERIDII